jgi:hypothetical protein
MSTTATNPLTTLVATAAATAVVAAAAKFDVVGARTRHGRRRTLTAASFSAVRLARLALVLLPLQLMMKRLMWSLVRRLSRV